MYPVRRSARPVALCVLLLLPAASHADDRPGRSERAKLETLEASAREFALGVAAHEHGDLTVAEGAYQRALRADAAFIEARVNLARVWIDQGRLADARKLLEAAPPQRGEYPPLYAVRGLLAQRDGDWSLARSELERALELDPASLETRVNLAALYLERRQHAEARVQLERALDLDPLSPVVVFNRALLEDLTGHHPEAIYYYDLFLELDGSQSERARAVKRRLAELLPSHPHASREDAPDASTGAVDPLRDAVPAAPDLEPR